MIISNCIKRIFPTWCKFFFYLFLNSVFVIESCSNAKEMRAGKNSDSLSIFKTVQHDAAVSPNGFKAEALLVNSSVDTSKETLIYFLLVENVLERGPSLPYTVAKGDTIYAESASPSTRLQNGNLFNVVIEERMQLNSETPLFILRSIRRK
jgi:hypothetical protein